MQYYSALKNKEIQTYTTTQMKLENIILNEISRSQKRHIQYDSVYTRYLEWSKSGDRK